MNNQYHEILQGLSVNELRINQSGARAVKACVELMLNTSVDFATATTLATLLMAHLKRLEPSEDFAENFEENRPQYYSSEVVYVAFFLLYFCEKVHNLDEIILTKDQGWSYTHFLPKNALDADVCDRCGEKIGRAIPIEQAAYDNVPPYHIGCRCRPFLMREADSYAAPSTRKTL